MGYAAYIRALLQPLQVYALDGGFEDAETEAIGALLDDVERALTVNEREMLPLTACGYGLETFRALMDYPLPDGSAAALRACLCALLCVGGGSFTRQAINDILHHIGAVVRETEKSGTLEVSFPGVWGEPEELERLSRVVEAVLPCHLQVEYAFVYITWQQLETLYPTWEALEAGATSWAELERAGRQEQE